MNITVNVLQDSDNEPLGGATVTFSYPAIEDISGSISDGSGVSLTSISTLPLDYKYTVKVNAEGFGQAGFQVSGQEASETTAYMIALSTMRVEIKIVDVDTKMGIKSATVSVSNWTPPPGVGGTYGSTNADGRVSLEVPLSRTGMKIHATHPDYEATKVSATSTATAFTPITLELKKKAITKAALLGPETDATFV